MRFAQAQEAISIAEGPLRNEFKQSGMIFPAMIEATIRASELLGPVVIFPEMPEHFDKRVLNRQSTVDCSHKQVHEWRARRNADTQAAKAAVAAKKITAADLEKKLCDRMRNCKDGAGEADADGFIQFKCKCKESKTFSSAKEFKSHEKLSKHKKAFGKVNERGDYVPDN